MYLFFIIKDILIVVSNTLLQKLVIRFEAKTQKILNKLFKKKK